MITKEKMDSIAAMIGIKADVLAKAISDEQEIDLELPTNGRYLSKEQEETILDNHGKRKYDEGVKKNQKEVFDGKTKEEFLSEYKLSVLEEAKQEPNKKITEKEEAIKALQATLSERDNALNALKNEVEGVKRNADIKSFLPSFKDGYSPEDALTIYNANHKKEGDSIYRNGNLLTDDTQSPLSEEMAVKKFFEEKGWIAPKIAGNGGNKPNSSGADPTTYEGFQKVVASKGWNEGSQQAKEYLASVRAKNPAFEI